MKTLFTLLLVLILAQPLIAANYSFTSNSRQEAAINEARIRYNQENETNLNNVQYIRLIIRTSVNSYVRQFADEDHTSLRESYRNADQATKDQIKALLGR